MSTRSASGRSLDRTDWLEEARALASRGVLVLRVAETYPPERAADAHRRMEAGGLRGRAVIVFPEERVRRSSIRSRARSPRPGRRRPRGRAARRERRARGRPRRTRVSSSSSELTRRAGQPKERASPERSMSGNRGQTAAAAVELGEAIHHRVAAVREDHEDRADPVVRRGPERLDRVERGPVADDREHRALRPGHPDPDRGRHREPEPAHRGAHEPERSARGDPARAAPACWTAPPRARPRHAAGAARAPTKTYAEVSGLCAARTGASRAACRRAPSSPAACGSRAASSSHAAATGARTTSSAALRCASSASSVTTATLVSAPWNGPGAYVYWRNAGAPTTRTASKGSRTARSRVRSEGRCPAKRGWSCGNPARAPNDSCQTGASSLLRDLDERVPGSLLVRSGADDDGGALGAVEQRDERVDGGGVGGGGTQDGPGGGGRIALVRRRSGPVVHRHDDERRPASGRRLVPRAGDRAGEVLRPDRLLDRDGVRAREPFEAAGEERLVGEVAPVLLSDEHDERRSVRRAPSPGRRPRCRDRRSCGGGRGPARSGRSPSRSRSRRPTLRAAPGRTRDRAAGRRAAAPRSSRGSRTSGSARARETPRSPRRARSPVPFVRPYPTPLSPSTSRPAAGPRRGRRRRSP